MKKRKVTDDKPFEKLNTTRQRVPRVPFEEIAQFVMKKDYKLSLVFIGDQKARALNITHRKKETPANVLSFDLGPHAGEVFLNLDRAKREAHLYESSYANHLAHLFIHGLFHLKGHAHGSTMEKAERQVRQRFNLQ